MGRRYLGGSGERLTVWISIAASTVLIFYGYDQGVFGNVLVKQDFLDTVGNPSTSAQGTMTSVCRPSQVWIGLVNVVHGL